MADIVHTVPLGAQWPGIDPFLFCSHRVGATAGFPQRPHSGFETVTYVRRGFIDQFDSLGAAARYGVGDVQWLTAGRGVAYSETLPLLDRDGLDPTEVFRIRLNLPGARKRVDPYSEILWAEEIPHHDVIDERGRRVSVTMIAGELEGLRPPRPPPDSWASYPEGDVAIWLIELDPQASCNLPQAASERTVRTIYVYEGSVRIGTRSIDVPTAVVVRTGEAISMQAGPQRSAALLLQGRPIGEPVRQHGPFVMNDRGGIDRAFADYRATRFGGWPYPVDDPVHPPACGRFDRHRDGYVDRPRAIQLINSE